MEERGQKEKLGFGFVRMLKWRENCFSPCDGWWFCECTWPGLCPGHYKTTAYKDLLQYARPVKTLDTLSHSSQWGTESKTFWLVVSNKQRLASFLSSSKTTTSLNNSFPIPPSDATQTVNLRALTHLDSPVNLCFRVCVMCLRTTTESSGGNRLGSCCSPTLTWYEPAPSQWSPCTANYTLSPPLHSQTQLLCHLY